MINPVQKQTKDGVIGMTGFDKYFAQAAKKNKVSVTEVTRDMFFAEARKYGVRKSQIAKMGGFGNIKEELYGVKSKLVQKHITFEKPKKEKKLVFKKAPLTSFKCHDVDFKKLWKQCGLKQGDVLRTIAIPDSHIPYHHIAAYNSLYKFLLQYKPHAMVLMGDFLECDAVSHWPNDSLKPRRFVPQIKTGIEVLERLEKAAGKQCILKRYIMGNHSAWLEQFLTARIPEVLDGLEELGPDLSIRSLLKLDKFGYKVIPLNEVFRLGDLCYIHGMYTCTSHASKHLSIFKTNVVYGHLHDTQSHVGTSIHGTHEAASLGCLRTLDAPFLKGRPSNWVLSFTMIEYRYDGSYTRYSPALSNEGVFSFNGKIFDGNVK